MIDIKMMIDPFDARDYFLYWDFFNKTKEDLSDFSLDIYRSVDDGDDYQKVKSNESLQAKIFKDRRISKNKRWLRLKYKIKLKKTSTGEEFWFGPVSIEKLGTPSDRLKIQHTKRKMLEFGNPFVVCKLNDSGDRCSCWNETLGKTEVLNCSECNGVGFKKGYGSFFFTKIKIDAETISESNNNSEEQRSSRTFALSNFPRIGSGDLLIDRYNKRFKVLGVQLVIPHGVVIKQMVSVTEVSRSEFEMKVDIPKDFKTILNELK